MPTVVLPDTAATTDTAATDTATTDTGDPTADAPASRSDAIARLLLVSGGVLLPWALGLLRVLPATTTVVHWNIAWTGLDLLEVGGLVTAGVLRRRDDPRQVLALVVAATAIGLDAWFDVLTAATGADRTLALAMLPLELASGTFCAVLAGREVSRWSAVRPRAARRPGSTWTGRRR